MLPFAHIVLHVTLCHAIARTAPQTSVTMYVRLLDHVGDPLVKKTFTFERGEDPQQLVELDAPQGTLKLLVSVPKYHCAAQDYLGVLSGHARNVNETLSDGPAPQTTPILMEGTAPPSFLYVQPTFILVAKDTKCNAPIGPQTPLDIKVENDQDAYYAWLYPDASLYQHPVLLALKIGTATGEFHYIRVPMPFPVLWEGWPENVQFSLQEYEIDNLAGKPINTLLCPKLYKTSVG